MLGPQSGGDRVQRVKGTGAPGEEQTMLRPGGWARTTSLKEEQDGQEAAGGKPPPCPSPHPLSPKG